MTVAAALAALVLFSLSAWGWGGLVLRVSSPSRNEGGEAPYRVALGIAALAAAGGWLNLLGVAYPPALWALLTVGWAASFFAIRRRKISMAFDASWLPWLFVAAVGLFLAATLMPSVIYNADDDLFAYFPRPVRMLQTGTLAGDPFETLGIDSLGTHAFLQSFVLLALRIAFINAFDAVFCVVLSLSLVLCIAQRLSSRWSVQAAALACLVLVHPQQVNITAVYAMVALSLAVLLAGRALTAGLLLAALIGLKVTSLTLVAPAALVFLALRRPSRRHTAAVAAWTALFAAPWLLLSAPRYARVLREIGAGEAGALAGSPFDLLSSASLRFGASIPAFNLAAALALAVALGGIFHAVRHSGERRPAELYALLALCAGAGFAYLFNTVPFGWEPGIRQSTFALIASMSAAVLAAGTLLAGVVPPHALLAVPLVLALFFGSGLVQRIQYAATWHTICSFPFADADYDAKHMTLTLGPVGEQWIRRAQAHTQPGATLLALVSHPHHLYFARNPVFVASKLGVVAFGKDLAPGIGAEGLRAVLRGQGVRYVIWQTDGLAAWSDWMLGAHAASPFPLDQRSARHMASFLGALRELSQSAKVAERGEGIVVLDLE